MARKPTGQVIERTGRDGRMYRSLRFRAYGERRFLALGAVSADEAARELRGVLADVERGTWRPGVAAPAPAADPGATTFHESRRWSGGRSANGNSRRKPRRTTGGGLRSTCCPYYGERRLDSIGIADVDRYRAAKLAERRPLSPRSINMTLTLLSAILEVAEERELIARNPARGRRRRVKAGKPQRSFIDTAAQITALLDAAGQLDADARADRQHVARRAMLATMCLGGLRVGELRELRWRDVDLAAGRLRIGRAKTDAGVRDVGLRPALRDELAALKASRAKAAPGALVFASSTGAPFGESNVRRRVLAPAIALANEALEEVGAPPLPDKLSPHALRRTFASLLVASGPTRPW